MQRLRSGQPIAAIADALQQQRLSRWTHCTCTFPFLITPPTTNEHLLALTLNVYHDRPRQTDVRTPSLHKTPFVDGTKWFGWWRRVANTQQNTTWTHGNNFDKQKLIEVLSCALLELWQLLLQHDTKWNNAHVHRAQCARAINVVEYIVTSPQRWIQRLHSRLISIHFRPLPIFSNSHSHV